jgi:hypothetical protein
VGEKWREFDFGVAEGFFRHIATEMYCISVASIDIGFRGFRVVFRLFSQKTWAFSGEVLQNDTL